MKFIGALGTPQFEFEGGKGGGSGCCCQVAFAYFVFLEARGLL